jgi:hypothetical protein
MHRDVVILVKEKEKDAAVERVEDFLEPGLYTDWDDYETLEVVPLADCLKEVKEMCLDSNADAEEAFERLLEAREHEKQRNITDFAFLSSHYAHRYYLKKSKKLSFSSGVFDLESYVAERVPDDIDGYWAVFVDLHQ